jgi:hypothetical protein
MITPEEEEFIREHAYLPEHVLSYGASISALEPFLTEGYLYFSRKGGSLVFIGYSLDQAQDSQNMEEVLRAVVDARHPADVAILAPSVPSDYGPPIEKDHYYTLDLAGLQIPSKVANMVRRASRGLRITQGRNLSPDHLALIRDFCESRLISRDTRTIFQRIPFYLEASPEAVVFTARDGDGNLAAFDVADFWATHCAFYMFNFRSCRHSFPGASDLLLHDLIAESTSRGKSRVNLGLGINAGVTFFKTKWGACRFLPHESVLCACKPPSLFESLLQGLH